MTSLVTTDQFIYQVEHSKDDETKAVYVVEAVLITLATIAVILRFLSRRIKVAPYLLDDWLIVVALVGLLTTSNALELEAKTLIIPGARHLRMASLLLEYYLPTMAWASMPSRSEYRT